MKITRKEEEKRDRASGQLRFTKRSLASTLVLLHLFFELQRYLPVGMQPLAYKKEL